MQTGGQFSNSQVQKKLDFMNQQKSSMNFLQGAHLDNGQKMDSHKQKVLEADTIQ